MYGPTSKNELFTTAPRLVGIDQVSEGVLRVATHYDERLPWMVFAPRERLFDPLRSNSRFRDVIGRMGLTP